MVSDLSFLFDIFLIEVKDDGAYHQKRHALVKHVLFFSLMSVILVYISLPNRTGSPFTFDTLKHFIRGLDAG